MKKAFVGAAKIGLILLSVTIAVYLVAISPVILSAISTIFTTTSVAPTANQNITNTTSFSFNATSNMTIDSVFWQYFRQGDMGGWTNITVNTTDGKIFNKSIALNSSIIPDGNYTVRAYWENLSASGASANISNVLFDFSAPKVYLATPANGNRSQNLTPMFRFYYNDTVRNLTNKLKYRCTLLLNGTAYGTNLTTDNASVTGATRLQVNTSLSRGIGYSARVKCTDYAGNSRNSSAAYIEISPFELGTIFTLVAPTANTNITNSSAYTFNATSNMTVNFVVWQYFRKGDMGGWANITTNSTGGSGLVFNKSLYLNSSSIPDGNYTLRVYFANNTHYGNSTNTSNVILDFTLPKVYLATPTNGNRSHNTTPMFRFYYNDTVFNLTNPQKYRCTILLNGTAYGTNTTTQNASTTRIQANTSLTKGAGYSARVKCTDYAGNSKNSTANYIEIADSLGWIFSTTGVAPTANQNITNTTNFSFNATANMTVSSAVWQFFRRGDMGGWVNITTNTTNGKIFNKSIALNSSLISDGNYTIRAYFSNATVSGYSANISNVLFDFIAPEVYIATPANGNRTINTTPIFRFYYNDTVKNLTNPQKYRCTLLLNGTAYGTNTTTQNQSTTRIQANTSLIAKRGYSTRIKCTDYAGNSKNSSARYIQILPSYLGDIFTSVAPAANANITNSSAYAFNATSNMTVSFAVWQFFRRGDMGGWTNITTNATASDSGVGWITSVSLNSSFIPDGNYTVRTFWANDTLNGTSANTSNVLFDSTSPKVYIATPANGNATTNSTPIFRFYYNDTVRNLTNPQKYRCTLLINGTAYGTNRTTQNASTTRIQVNATLTANKGYSARIKCTDYAGNSKNSSARYITISAVNTGAIFSTTSISPRANQNITNTTNFSFNATSNMTVSSAVWQFFRKGDMGGWTNITVNTTNGKIFNKSIALNSSRIPDGNYTVRVYFANDTANGKSDNISNVLFDFTPPEVYILTPSNGNTTTETSPIFRFYYNDSVINLTSGHKYRCTVIVNGTEYGTNLTTVNATVTRIQLNATFGTGGYRWSANCTDYAGNEGNSTWKYFTIVSLPESSSGSSGSGGGGGGGGSTTSVTMSWNEINPGYTKTMEISKSGWGMTAIDFELTSRATDVKISVKKLASRPAGTAEPGHLVYQYYNISLTNLNDSIVKYARMSFNATKSWLIENGFKKGEANLYRYTTEWEKLETTILSEDEENVQYRAESPGFSYFSIGAAESEQICIPGERTCDGKALKQCSSDGMAWEELEACDYRCNAETLQCEQACTENERRCYGDKIQECLNSTWTEIETCEHGCNNASCNAPPAPGVTEGRRINLFLVFSVLFAVIIVLLMILNHYLDLLGRIKLRIIFRERRKSRFIDPFRWGSEKISRNKVLIPVILIIALIGAFAYIGSNNIGMGGAPMESGAAYPNPLIIVAVVAAAVIAVFFVIKILFFKR